jgi:Asp-tRNA(Asn)/Glu-tRNA(Gln) amidotransferase A subunit family amidase
MPNGELIRLPARDAAERIRRGSLTSQALVEAFLARITAREDAVGAFAHLDPAQALAAARARDGEAPRGPLHGVPLGVKDIMDTADMPTEYGSRLYAGHRPTADAACVALARAKGAVILGKTVTTEFANVSPGKTRHPKNPAHTPGGSSSGSAAGVADGMMPLAFGTQTAGSVLRPAAFCGVVGYKPTFNCIPIAGTKIQSPTLDTVGAFARDVRDAAWFVAALTDRPALVPQHPAAAPRIGRYRPAVADRAAPYTWPALDRVAAALTDAGATIVERGPFAPFDDLESVQATIMLHEAARNLAWERVAPPDRLAPATRRMLAEAAAITVEAYDTAMRRAEQAWAQREAFFGDCDAMLVPAAPGEAPPGLETTGDPVFNRAWTLLHGPCISIPVGPGPGGLPLGAQLVARPHDDARLLAIALLAETALVAAG